MEIEIEKGFLENVEKRVLHTQDHFWVDETYVDALELEFGKMLTIAKEALQLAAQARVTLNLERGTPKVED